MAGGEFARGDLEQDLPDETRAGEVKTGEEEKAGEEYI